jgi:4-hydroxy-tetrahydrodipicolinate synthase
MNIKLEGVVVPLLTPFTRDTDRLDVPAFRRLIDRLIAAGVSGIIANAGTSEYYHLSEDERELEAEVAIEQAAGRVPVLIGASAISTNQTIRWAKHAAALGAAGLLVMPPYYAAIPVDAILKHFAAISDAVSTPMMLYNNPFVAQVLLMPEEIARLIEVANVPWIKLTTKQVEHVPLILERVGDKASVFEGVDTIAFPSLANGSVGWIAGPANAIPELAIELWRLVRVEADLKRAYALHRRLLPFLDYAVNGGMFCSFLKEICGLRGYALGATRAPFSELTDAGKRRAVEFAVELGLIGNLPNSKSTA